MADFALWVTAAEEGLGWENGAFVKAYAANRDSSVSSLIDTQPVARPIIEISENGGFEGTATELLARLDEHVSEKVSRHRSFPPTPSALGKCLARIAPALRAVGVNIRRERASSKDRCRLWIIEASAGVNGHPV